MDDKQTEKTPKRRLIKLALVISLGFNILVLGLVGGAFVRGGPPDHIRADRQISVLGLRAYFRALDDESQQGLRDRIKESSGEINAGRVEFRAHVMALSQAIAAVPYDPAAVKQVLSEHGIVVADNISVGHRLLVEQIDLMSPQQRSDLAETLLTPRKRLGRRKD
ncbi:MAG: putative membrane protein [Paracoccaceae bacterium]|jgi:uncharacterized membrane protein